MNNSFFVTGNGTENEDEDVKVKPLIVRVNSAEVLAYHTASQKDLPPTTVSSIKN